ncbi:MAG: hypothetical protein HOK52_04365 [Candidatus Marinimicrobia bacterium]|jgi:hypothetical protein|nr:hypothetical protein [Candidatus Woesearchaeota archaeon]MBT6470475.1 hypothetical protein [Candidatus Neomarinimicrobiota bacterium]
MNVLFVASEVGSVRAIYPIMQLCKKNNISFSYIKIGYFKVIGNNNRNVYSVQNYQDNEQLIKSLVEKKITTVVFSVNIKDNRPLQIARAAKIARITTIHILDYWNGYLARMRLDCKKTFHPNYYVVPDEIAKVAAIKEGLPSEIIKVYGQPAFSDAIEDYKLNRAVLRDNLLISNGLSLAGKLILFVSEPVKMDFGLSKSNNEYYKGYTEHDVVPLVQKNLSLFSNIETCVLPHPRENVGKLIGLWSLKGLYKSWVVIPNIRGRELLPFVDGVIGMASTLLYEAWLVGVPVLSIQPGLVQDNLRMLQNRDGVEFVDKAEDSDRVINEWLSNISVKKPLSVDKGTINARSVLHNKSIELILSLIN